MTGLLKRTGEHLISIFAEHEVDSDEELQHLYTLNTRLIQEINAERNAGKMKKKEMEAAHKAEMQRVMEEIEKAQVELGRVKDRVGFGKEEAGLLEERLQRATTLRTELAQALQSPEPANVDAEESTEWLRSELQTSQQIQANLRAVMRADELLLEEALRTKEQEAERLHSCEADLDKATQTRLQLAQKHAEKLHELQQALTQVSIKPETDERDLEELLASQRRTIASLQNEKSALLLQLDCINGRQVGRKREVNALAELPVIQESPRLVRVAETVDAGLAHLRGAMDEVAAVKLLVVGYLAVLHLWALLSTLGIGGC